MIKHKYLLLLIMQALSFYMCVCMHVYEHTHMFIYARIHIYTGWGKSRFTVIHIDSNTIIDKQ